MESTARVGLTTQVRSTAQVGSTTQKGAPALGPPGERILGSTRSFRRDVLATAVDGHNAYGDVVRFTGIGRRFPLYLVTHPDGVRRVLQDNVANYRPIAGVRAPAYPRRGTEPSSGTEPGSGTEPSGCAELTADAVQEILARWEPVGGSPRQVDLTGETTLLALTVLGRALLDGNWWSHAELIERALPMTVGEVDRSVGNAAGLPWWVPVSSNRARRAANGDLARVVDRAIAARQLARRGHHLRAVPAASAVCERDEVLDFLRAGHETFVSGVTGALRLLARHVTVARRLADEVTSVVAGDCPTLDYLKRMPYLEGVARESLRLLPPAPLLGRVTVDGDEIGGVQIPSGATVLLSAHITHRHAEFWSNPEGFDPERWVGGSRTAPHPFSWIPFSPAPPRAALPTLGLPEMMVAVAMIVQRFEIALRPGMPSPTGTSADRYRPVVATLRPRGVATDDSAAPPAGAAMSAAECPVHRPAASSGCPIAH